MGARSVQISVDEELLRQVDRRPETKRDGRSAVIRRALEFYLASDERARIDAAYVRGYGSRADNELDELLDGQAWPEE